MLARIRRLEEHNRWLEQRIRELTDERDAWKEKAVEISAMLTCVGDSLRNGNIHLVAEVIHGGDK